MKLVFVRHGESEWNALNLFTGWSDVELTQKGEQEAHHAGKVLRSLGIQFDHVYLSVLKRAIHTGHIVLSELNQDYLPETKSWRLMNAIMEPYKDSTNKKPVKNTAMNKCCFGDVLMT